MAGTFAFIFFLTGIGMVIGSCLTFLYIWLRNKPDTYDPHKRDEHEDNSI